MHMMIGRIRTAGIFLAWIFRVVTCTSISLHIRKVPLVFLQTPLPFEFTKHTIATVEDNRTNSRVILDFVPLDRSISLSGATSAILLLMNQNQPGKVRCVRMSQSQELEALVKNILQNWDDNINIYSHNCQDFTRHVQSCCQDDSNSRLTNEDKDDFDDDVSLNNETRQIVSYIYDAFISLVFIGVAIQVASGL